MRLRAKILICAVANLVLLGLAVAVFVHLQFRPGVESILLAPGEARVRELADKIEADLSKTASSGWDAVLARYERRRASTWGSSCREPRIPSPERSGRFHSKFRRAPFRLLQTAHLSKINVCF